MEGFFDGGGGVNMESSDDELGMAMNMPVPQVALPFTSAPSDWSTAMHMRARYVVLEAGEQGVLPYGAYRIRPERPTPFRPTLTIPDAHARGVDPYDSEHHPRLYLVCCDLRGEAVEGAPLLTAGPETFEFDGEPTFTFSNGALSVTMPFYIRTTCFNVNCNYFRLRYEVPALGLVHLSQAFLVAFNLNPDLNDAFQLTSLIRVRQDVVRVRSGGAAGGGEGWELYPAMQIVQVDGEFLEGYRLFFSWNNALEEAQIVENTGKRISCHPPALPPVGRVEIIAARLPVGEEENPDAVQNGLGGGGWIIAYRKLSILFRDASIMTLASMGGVTANPRNRS